MLGLPEPAKVLAYTAALDAVVESFWGKARTEYEERDPVAEMVYHSLVSTVMLGGCPSSIVDDVRLLLEVLPVSKSTWMKTQCARGLRAALRLHSDQLGDSLAADISAAIASKELPQ